MDIVAEELRTTSPSSFRHCRVQGRNGDKKAFWAFTKVVRLKKSGKKRLVIAHETEDLSDAPRFLLADALHWDITRIIRALELSLVGRSLSRVCQANNWFGVLSGAQLRSGSTPLSSFVV